MAWAIRIERNNENGEASFWKAAVKKLSVLRRSKWRTSAEIWNRNTELRQMLIAPCLIYRAIAEVRNKPCADKSKA
jgi:hypothetical protein